MGKDEAWFRGSLEKLSKLKDWREGSVEELANEVKSMMESCLRVLAQSEGVTGDFEMEVAPLSRTSNKTNMTVTISVVHDPSISSFFKKLVGPGMEMICGKGSDSKTPLNKIFFKGAPWELRESILNRTIERIPVQVSSLKGKKDMDSVYRLMREMEEASKGEVWEKELKEVFTRQAEILAKTERWERDFVDEWNKGSHKIEWSSGKLLSTVLSENRSHVVEIETDGTGRRIHDVVWAVDENDPRGSARRLKKALIENSCEARRVEGELRRRLARMVSEGLLPKDCEAETLSVLPQFTKLDSCNLELSVSIKNIETTNVVLTSTDLDKSWDECMSLIVSSYLSAENKNMEDAIHEISSRLERYSFEKDENISVGNELRKPRL